MLPRGAGEKAVLIILLKVCPCQPPVSVNGRSEVSSWVLATSDATLWPSLIGASSVVVPYRSLTFNMLHPPLGWALALNGHCALHVILAVLGILLLTLFVWELYLINRSTHS